MNHGKQKVSMLGVPYFAVTLQSVWRTFHDGGGYVCIYNIYVPAVHGPAVQYVMEQWLHGFHKSSPFMAHEGQNIKLMPNQIWNEIIAGEITGSKHPALLTNWEPKDLLNRDAR